MRQRRVRRRTVWVIVSALALAILAGTVTTQVLERRAEGEARAVLDDVGVPPGFQSAGATVGGSVYCFGPCFRVHGRYVADMPFAEALPRIMEYLRSKGAVKACGLTLNCETPLAPEDCRALDDGPVCRTSIVVGGRPVLVSVSRTGPPTELELMTRPQKDINLFI